MTIAVLHIEDSRGNVLSAASERLIDRLLQRIVIALKSESASPTH